MNIVFYDQFSLSYGGGGEVWLVNVAQRLAKRGAEVSVITSSRTIEGVQEAQLAHLLDEKPLFEILQLRSFTAPMGFPVLYPNGFSTLTRRATNADVLYYLHEMPLVEIPLFLSARKKGRPKVIAVYQGSLNTDLALLRFTMRTTARVMMLLGTVDAHQVLTPKDAELLRTVGARSVSVIPNGTDLSKFRPTIPKDRTGPFCILFVGRLSLQKGFDIFYKIVKAINSQSASDKPVRFIVIGSGELEERAKLLQGTHDNVEYIPYVEHREMPGQYARSDLFLAPYRYEGHPLSVIEAQACGLPVVATALPGITESVVDGWTGTLVPKPDDSLMSRLVLGYRDMFYDDSQRYISLGANACSNAARFDWEKIVDKMVELMDKVLSRNPSSSDFR